MPDSSPVDDETSVVTIAAAATPPLQVWDVLVNRTAEWWAGPYLAPDEGTMSMEPRLGGAVWATPNQAGDADDPTGERQSSNGPPAGPAVLHGTIRAFDPPERLEIGGVLVPGAYAGSITITIEKTNLGAEIRVEHMARGRVTATTEESIAHGWTQMTAKLTELAEQ